VEAGFWRKIMEREKWSSLVWLGVGILICIGSLMLSLGQFRKPGPGFLSFFAGLLMAGLALAVHLQARKSRPDAGREKPGPIWSDRQRGIKMAMTVAALLGYAVAMNYLGFLLSTFLFLAFLFKAIAPQRWAVALAGSLVASAAFYGIFEFGLQCQLPKGILRMF
jgi:putative tricarboxylic transport membrane protein